MGVWKGAGGVGGGRKGVREGWRREATAQQFGAHMSSEVGRGDAGVMIPELDAAVPPRPRRVSGRRIES